MIMFTTTDGMYQMPEIVGKRITDLYERIEDLEANVADLKKSVSDESRNTASTAARVAIDRADIKSIVKYFEHLGIDVKHDVPDSTSNPIEASVCYKCDEDCESCDQETVRKCETLNCADCKYLDVDC